MGQADTRNSNNAYAAAAIQAISDHSLQIDPKTFSVWYEYFRGVNPALRRVIDIILSNRSPITAAAVEQIYDRYIDNSADSKIVRETSERMQQMLAKLLDLVGEAKSDASQFGDAVRTVSGQFAATELSISGLVQCLLSEAKEICARTDRIQAELVRNAELMDMMKRSLEESRREAATDPLTGLANRRCFEEVLQQRAGQAMNDGMELSLLLLDIDHFKRVNDSWGHPVGDEVLKLAAQTLRNNLRDTDLAARYGGEEFAVLLPGLAIGPAAKLGDRIRLAFAGKQVVLRGSGQTIGSVTVSVGVAAYDPGEPLSQWVDRTDAALYQAKQSGRNRVVAARAPEVAATS